MNRKQRAWCFYDWANSVYSLVITSTIFPVYFAATTRQANGSNLVSILGFELPSSSLFSYTVSASFLTVALLSPILSSLADSSGKRKFFWQLFCYLGAASCAGLFFFTESTLGLGLLFFYVATIGFCGSLVFYNAYLPDLAPANEQDALSAKGFAYGYVGSVLLQILCFIPLLKPEWVGGVSSGTAARFAFLATGLWWAGFAQIPFRILPEIKPLTENKRSGFTALRHTFETVKALPRLSTYLLAFFFYNMGVQTIMYLATLFGSIELKLADEKLILTILLLQILAIAGALLTARLSAKIGNIPALRLLVCMWIGICVSAYFIQTEYQFYALASVVGLIMGGIQALSRSTWARWLPENEPNHTSFFSLLDFTDKISIVAGTFVFGLVQQVTGSMRLSALALAIFFLIGLVILLRLKSKTGMNISYAQTA